MMQHNINRLYTNILDNIIGVKQEHEKTIEHQVDLLNNIVNIINSNITNLHTELKTNKQLEQIQDMFVAYAEFQKKHIMNDQLYISSPIYSLDILFAPFAATIKDIRTELETKPIEETYIQIKNTCEMNMTNIVVVGIVFDKLCDFLNKTITHISYPMYESNEPYTTYNVDGKTYKLAFVASSQAVTESMPTQQTINLSHFGELDAYLNKCDKIELTATNYDIPDQQLYEHTYFSTGGTEKDAANVAIYKLLDLINSIEKLYTKYRSVKQQLQFYMKNEKRVTCYLTYLSYVTHKTVSKVYMHINKTIIFKSLAIINYILTKIQEHSNEIKIKYFDDLHFFTVQRVKNLLTFLDTVVSEGQMLDVTQTTGPILADIAVLNHFQPILDSYAAL